MKLHSVDSKEKEIGRLRAQVVALEQLLAVHEQTVTAQASRIEESRQQIEAQSEALQAIMTGTASVTGHDFFSSLVTSLADVLKVRYAFVGELHDSRIKQIHTLAVWSRDRLSDNFSYGLAGTPCANVVEGSLCSYQQEVRRQFPHDALLAEWEVESCCSVPLFDRSECVIGALVVMHDRRMQTAFDVQRMLTIFAARAGAELERKRAEQSLRQTSERSLKQESALLNLTQSEGLQTGDLASGLRCITETAAQTLGVSRVSIWRYSDGRQTIQCLDLYALDSDRHCSGMELRADCYPAYFRSLATTRIIVADEVHQDPRTGELSADYLSPLGISSMMDVPIYLFGRLDGVICHEHVSPSRRWMQDEQIFAMAVANQLSLFYEQCERKRAQEALRQSEERLRVALNAVHMGIWDWNIRTNEVTWSENVKLIFGLGPETFGATYEAYLKLVHPDDREMLVRSAANCIEKDLEYSVEHRIVRRDQSFRWVACKGSVLHDGTGKAIRMLGTVMDITDRKRLEDQLRHVQKMEAVGRLAGGVAHDFNNLLTVISGYSQLLLSRVAPGDGLRDEVESISQAGDRAHGTETILFVEDQAMVRKYVTDVLTEHGYHLLEAASGDEALRCSETHRGRIDLLLTDVVMPSMNGHQLSEKIATLRPDIKVLYMSGYAGEAVLREEEMLNGTPFLQKPIAPDMLLNKVRELLDGPLEKPR